MKVQLTLFAGALTGLSLIATPALSQVGSQPQPQRPPTMQPGGQQVAQQFRQVGQMLEGNWSITVRTFASGAGNAGAQQQPSSETQGTATREWVLDEHALTEEVRTQGDIPVTTGSNLQNSMQQTQPGQSPRPGSTMGGQGFQGHGMFSFNPQGNEFQHVWASNKDSRLAFSTGRYDERTRTITFMVKDAQSSGMQQPSTPGMTPGATQPQRPGTTPTPPGGTRPSPSTPPDADDDDTRYQVTTPPRPGQPQTQPGQPAQPGASGQNIDLSKVDRVVIRILDEDRHTVEYYTNSPAGAATQPAQAGQAQGNRIMEIVYTKSN